MVGEIGLKSERVIEEGRRGKRKIELSIRKIKEGFPG